MRRWTASGGGGGFALRLCGPPPSLWTARRVLWAVCAAMEAALSASMLGRRTAAVRAEAATGPRAAERVVLACDEAIRGCLAAWLQGHDGIEKRTNQVRHVTHGEDASRVRT